MTQNPPGSWARYLPTGLAAVLVAASLAVAFQVLPIHHYQTGRLAKLVVAEAPAGYKSKAAVSSVEDSTQSPFPAVKTALKHSPHQTGTYAIEWTGNTSGDTAEILASLLPSDGQARSVATEAKTVSLGPNAYKTQSYKGVTSFEVPGVPGAAGELYSPTTASVKQQLAVALVPVGRAVAVVYSNMAGPPATAQAVDATLAQQEYRQLTRTLAGFSLETTRWPTVATVVWFVVTAALAGAIITLPGAVRRARNRRELARQETARKQVLARGSKIARRQAAPRR
jgi:hypothetical protein